MRFETIGNATVICYEKETPILATDPWVFGPAYFGSWKLSHEIPPEQLQAIKDTKFIWFSHGHPDHLNSESLLALSDKTILLPDHVGARIKNDLTFQGIRVRVLKDREWVKLSPHISVCCVADYNQDALLFIDVNGKLLVNFNDGNALGSEHFVKKTIKKYTDRGSRAFLLRLFSYGDADMINYFTEDGKRILPAAAEKRPIGPIMAGYAEMYGVTDVIPFSCFHAYQRNDSIWASEYTTPAHAFIKDFQSKSVRLLPAFIRYDCLKDAFTELHPSPSKKVIIDSKTFGDDWSEELSASEVAEIKKYFKRIESLRGHIDRIVFRVGGKEYPVDISESEKRTSRQIYFDVPRGSLMSAIHFEVFDDLLIGNFMKTTLVGPWPASRLYPDFCPIVPKYADNGHAYSTKDMQNYFKSYRERNPFEFIVHRLQERSIQTFRNFVSPQNPAFEYGKKLYFFMKKS